MDHFVIADIDADMGCSRRVVSALEKHKVAGFDIGGGYTGADVPKTVSTKSSDVPTDTAVIDHPRHKTGAVERGGRAAAAPNIRIAEILFGFFYHSGKLWV